MVFPVLDKSSNFAQLNLLCKYVFSNGTIEVSTKRRLGFYQNTRRRIPKHTNLQVILHNLIYFASTYLAMVPSRFLRNVG